MQEGKINGVIPTSADKDWKYVSDFGGLDKFVGAVTE